MTFIHQSYFGNEVSSYNVYMGIQQAINLAIKDAFEREGIAIAYRTQQIQMAIPLPSEKICQPPLEKALH